MANTNTSDYPVITVDPATEAGLTHSQAALALIQVALDRALCETLEDGQVVFRVAELDACATLVHKVREQIDALCLQF